MTVTPNPQHADSLRSRRPTESHSQALLEALASQSRVSGYTHRFYRHPARFSPEFAASAIEAFTEPGDFVLDPFMGGGTSVVEALVRGRRVLGCDINRLAGFVTRAKTTPLTKKDRRALDTWQAGLEDSTRLNRPEKPDKEWQAYQRNLPWWLRGTLKLALNTLRVLEVRRQRRFARCSLLRTAQWALDCRDELPTRQAFLARHSTDFTSMLAGLTEFEQAAANAIGTGWRASLTRSRRLLVRTTAGLHEDSRLPSEWGSPRLILTSPPYVGVHILYHRWQIRGRRESAAPYWVAGELDGRPNSYYTFADRRRTSIEVYLTAMRAAYKSVVSMMGPQSTLVQLVAFARPEEQLPQFLATLDDLGLEPSSLTLEATDAHPYRTVPNRKWYTDANGRSGASKEYLLVHHRRF
jgi:hypothetical protein